MKKYLFPLIAFLATNCLASVTVNLSSPGNGANVSAPFTVNASASSGYTVTAWHIYLDSKDVYQGGKTGNISPSVNASAGSHTLVVRAWDSSGAYGDRTIKVNVTTSKGVSVNVSSPGNGGSLSAPFSLQASASSSHTVTAWHAYLDGKDVYQGGSTNNISASINASQGSHQLVVRAWDSTGAYGDQTIGFTVGQGGGDGLPTPPGNALVYNNIDQMNNGWDKCGDPGCAGGSGAGTFWQSFFQSDPSMDGSSMHLYRDGVWANALWWKKVGAQNGVSHFLADFYLRVDNASVSAGQALEFDAFQFVGGYNYMMGTQCDYGRGVWDIWNGTGGSWTPTSVPCPKFSPNTWHHIQWYMTNNHSNHSYTFVTLVVDGTVYNVNKTMYAKYLAWSDNLGAQWQLDVNKTGAGYHEWVDKAKLTVW